MAVYYQPGCKKCKDGKDDCNSSIDCKPKLVLADCNNLTGASGISVIAVGDTVTPRNIGTLTLRDLKCFKRPSIKVDLTATITVNAALAVDTVITFRVFRRCGTDPEIEIQSFDVSFGLALIAGATIPVAFSICDHDFCAADCCTYRVTVEATAAVAVASAINVNQGTISAIVSDIC